MTNLNTKQNANYYEELKQSTAYQTYCDDLAALDAILQERYPTSSTASRRQACRDLWHDQKCWNCIPSQTKECPKTVYTYWQIDKFECDAQGHLYPRLKPCIANPSYDVIIARRKKELAAKGGGVSNY